MTAADPPVTCARCGRARGSDDPATALTWVCERQHGRQLWLCPACARTHVRDIEGKLPQDYW